MATALDIVHRALKKAAILPRGEVASAEDASDCLNSLNDMMHGWKLRGADTSHVTLALSDTFPLADEFIEGTVFLLASRISPDYQIPPAFDADDFFRGIQAAYLVIDEVAMPSAMLNIPSSQTPLKVWP